MILTTIDGVPLYSTLQEALQWAAANGLQGYHTHTYQGSLGYMGGATHGSATIASASPTSSSTQPTSSGSTTMNTPSSSPSSGSSSGGGGY
tara:strand:+ start:442 stop:714 length:273 start_codon:yes stop_codon:yes gene_type:complete